MGEKTGVLIVFGGTFTTYLLASLDRLNIEPIQAFTLLIVFFLSSVIGLAKYKVLGLSIKEYLSSNILAKIFMIFIPFLVALISISIKAFHILVDLSFIVLIVEELVSFLISIQSIRTRQYIKEIAFYSILVNKVKQLSFKLLKFEENNKGQK